MKITTRAVYQWDKALDDYVLVEEDSYEYTGPVEEAKGGGSVPETQTTVTKPFPEQLPFSKRVFSEAQKLFNQGPQEFFPGQTVAPFSAETEQGLQLQTALAGGLVPQIQGTQTALQSLLRAPDPANDPTVLAFADAATNPLFRQFNEQILPGIQSGATASGAFGGSRQGILENQAAGDLASRVGDLRAGIFNTAFGQQLAAQQNALQLAPSIFAAQGIPGQLLTQVGAQRENLAQQLIDAERERFEFGQIAPLANLQNFAQLINGVPGTASTTSLPRQPQRSALSGAFGGAATGAAIGSAVPGIGTAIGAGVGGLLGLTGLI